MIERANFLLGAYMDICVIHYQRGWAKYPALKAEIIRELITEFEHLAKMSSS
jgi:hypothetical protein